ncbi:hypothetical protein HDU87_002456 [Geranomyces variabilis]|uniref:Uncharacterized protein n=1 Tax=Geranomyces variabilis TaxID=109894 RepID=A0AAD5XNA5_9FUNG|nr:hypothetical protein HDU87_002456 [Geranomyces variabilis]
MTARRPVGGATSISLGDASTPAPWSTTSHTTRGRISPPPTRTARAPVTSNPLWSTGGTGIIPTPPLSPQRTRPFAGQKNISQVSQIFGGETSGQSTAAAPPRTGKRLGPVPASRPPWSNSTDTSAPPRAAAPPPPRPSEPFSAQEVHRPGRKLLPPPGGAPAVSTAVFTGAPAPEAKSAPAADSARRELKEARDPASSPRVYRPARKPLAPPGGGSALSTSAFVGAPPADGPLDRKAAAPAAEASSVTRAAPAPKPSMQDHADPASSPRIHRPGRKLLPPPGGVRSVSTAEFAGGPSDTSRATTTAVAEKKDTVKPRIDPSTVSAVAGRSTGKHRVY